VPPPPQDDRVLPFTRVVAVVVIAILVLAFIVLYLLPGDTDRRFAWTIHPSMTAMVMGAGYGSALYFFARVLGERRWHRVALGFIPTTVFTWMMLGTTFLQWSDFRHGSMPFLLWLWVYLITPILVPVVWLVNRRHDPRVPEPDDRTFGRTIRIAMVAGGVVLVAIAAWMYLAPSSAIDAWPWALRAITARTIAAFIALPGVAWLAIAADGRWSASRITLHTVAIGLVLLMIAVARDWNDIEHRDVLTYVYVLGVLGTLGAIAALDPWSRSSGPSPPFDPAPWTRG
jgi:peptidoglycan/LPS O-acetylase OafA/YrhL